MRSARVNVCSGSSQPSLSSQQPKRWCNGLDRQLKNTRLSPQDCHYHSCLWWGHYSTAEKYHKNSEFFNPRKDLFTRLLSKKNAEITGPSHRHKKKRQKMKNGPMMCLSFYLPWSTSCFSFGICIELAGDHKTVLFWKKAKIREERN